MDKLRSTNRTKIYLFLCFWFIYLEEYRLYLETMNGTIKSIKFLFKNRTMHAISLLSIYIYCFDKRGKSWLLSTLEKILHSFRRMERNSNERKVLDWIRVSLLSDRKSARSEIDSTFILCENKQRLLFELLED